MQAAPLFIGSMQRERLHKLRDMAFEQPVDVATLVSRMKDDVARQEHKRQMTSQTIVLDGIFNFFVTFSIEDGHPGGRMRHMSMSIDREGRVPHPAAVWMIALELGFTGEISSCVGYLDDLSDGGKAVNLVQPIEP